jgi:DNA-binding MarR family transcriptional regulator
MEAIMGTKPDELSLSELYGEINERMGKVDKFVTVSSDIYKTPVDYGCGQKLAMMEVHTLSMIGYHPGIITAEIREKFGGYHSLSAISQNVAKLLRKELVYQVKKEDNDKNKHLYLTEQGEKIHLSHIQYDIANANKMMNSLLQHVTLDELNVFFRVIDAWSNLYIGYKQSLKQHDK